MKFREGGSIGDTAGAAGGALLGHKLGKGKSLYTALGAGGGVVLSESLQGGSRSSAQKSVGRWSAEIGIGVTSRHVEARI